MIFGFPIRLVSDLHLDGLVRQYGLGLGLLGELSRHEHLLAMVPPRRDDSETVLVVAGDLWEGLRPIAFGQKQYSWLGDLSARFRAIILVLGNHDCYGERVPRIYHKFREALTRWPNIHLLEAAVGFPSVMIDGVQFVGGTLWTDMRRGSPLACHQFDHAIGSNGRKLWNDRNFIKIFPSNYSWDSHSVMAQHSATLRGLDAQLADSDGPVVLVTHMAPMFPPADVARDIRAHDESDAFFYSDLSPFFMRHPNIGLALHGHTHDSLDYALPGLRVVCNPAGNIGDGQGNPAFDPALVL